MKKITKTFTVSILVFLLTFSLCFLFFKEFKKRNFENIKNDIIGELQTEISLMSLEGGKNEIQEIVEKLEETKDENDFYVLLNKSLDTDIEMEEQDFEEYKKLILVELEQEILNITDEPLKTELKEQVNKLKKSDTNFYKQLDIIYDEIDGFYEKNNILFFSEEDFISFDFKKEKVEIIADVESDILDIQDEKLKKELEKSLQELKEITDEDVFFKKLEDIDEKIYIYYVIAE